jgi:hypothetical protein
MKKKPASIPQKNKSSKPATKRKPLLKKAVEAAKKMLKSRRAKKSAAAETEVDATTVVRRTYLRPKKSEVPAILLEGDTSSVISPSGPGEKYSLGATAPAQRFSGGLLNTAIKKSLLLT